MTIQELQKELSFQSKGGFDLYISKLFGFKTVGAYQNSSAKKRYENALCKFYSFLNEGEKKKNQDSTEVDMSKEDLETENPCNIDIVNGSTLNKTNIFKGDCDKGIHWDTGVYSRGRWIYNKCSYCGKRKDV